MLIKKRITRILYKRKFYDYPVTLKLKVLKNMGFFNVINVFFSYIKTIIFKKKEDNLENFYINRFGKKLYSMFFENYTEKVWGKHPREISSEWGEQRVKGLSIKEILKDILKKVLNIKNKKNTEASLIEQFYYPKLGSGQMWETMKERILELGGKVICSANVSKINLEKNRIKSLQYKNKDKLIDIECDICISSMPIKDLFERLNDINYKIPENIYNSAINLPYREFMSACFLVDKINLTNNTEQRTISNILPDSWDYIQEPEVKVGRIQIFNNWSPYLFKNKEEVQNKVLLTLEYFCSEEDELWKMKDSEFFNFSINEAKKINLFSDTTKIYRKHRIKIEKAYPAYFGSYSNINSIIRFLDNIKNLYCIGRNGQHRYNNMDHSMLTGIEVARTILQNKINKESIWKVNTDKEYHEIKRESK